MSAFVEKVVRKIGLQNIYKVFMFFYVIYSALDTLLTLCLEYSLVTGWQKERDLAKARLDKSGHLVRILARGTSNPAGTASLEGHFMLRHEKYCDPEELILNSDKVTLMGISPTQVWFSITTKTDVYGLGKFPFVFMGHFFTAEKLLIIDHKTLHRLAEKLGDPQGNCILINNTGRCGSTLLCQVNNKLNIPIMLEFGNCICIIDVPKSAKYSGNV
jgi:hypothetical protein